MKYDLDLLVHEAISRVNGFDGAIHDYIFRVDDEIKTIEDQGVEYEEVTATLYDTQTDEVALHLQASTKPYYHNFIMISQRLAKTLNPFLRVFEKYKAKDTLLDFDYDFVPASRLQVK